jgi:hypothetical protein
VSVPVDKGRKQSKTVELRRKKAKKVAKVREGQTASQKVAKHSKKVEKAVAKHSRTPLINLSTNPKIQSGGKLWKTR